LRESHLTAREDDLDRIRQGFGAWSEHGTWVSSAQSGMSAMEWGPHFRRSRGPFRGHRGRAAKQKAAHGARAVCDPARGMRVAEDDA
jgi:hypothetical protein